MNICDNFDRISTLSNRDLVSRGAPYLFRLFTIAIKEFSSLFSIAEDDEQKCFYFYVSKDKNIIFKSSAVSFSCDRYIINADSKLFVSVKNGAWRTFNFDDFKHLLLIINKNYKINKDFDINNQIKKVIQQTRYYIFITERVFDTKINLKRYSRNHDFFSDLLFNSHKRILAFSLVDAFGVTYGHLDHPTPYPYSSGLKQSLLGADPFLSFIREMDKIIKLNDDELKSIIKKPDVLQKKFDVSSNGISLILVPRYFFVEDERLHLEEISSILNSTIKNLYGREIDYDKSKNYLLFIPEIERGFALSSKSLLFQECKILSESLFGISSSSGRSMIVPVVLENNKNSFLFLKTSWPDIIKTAYNRGLRISVVEWYLVCYEIFSSFSSNEFEFFSEEIFSPILKDHDVTKYLTFISRKLLMLERDKNEFVLPLIGLVVPNHAYPFDETPLVHFMKLSQNPELFLRCLVDCITKAIISQLLSKGVYHSSHLQNCCIIFKKNGKDILPIKALLRDGDIRVCEDYSSLLSIEEIKTISNLRKKRNKIYHEKKFYKHLFHNIINENFGNIEQCLLIDNQFSSEFFWRLVRSSFEDAIKRNVKVLKTRNEYRKIHGVIVKNFTETVFKGSGYSVNFFRMSFFGVKENFIKVHNPFLGRKSFELYTARSQSITDTKTNEEESLRL
ncbi:MAG: hypothetical protein PHH40_00710 [Candidatus Moranbacteria bacterium]|nr:hypothetical protein [Candidatus Moranbacteria bacterium]MDD3964834.1 hypothetical protein [Candidatus Moranbacteria bacterium]